MACGIGTRHFFRKLCCFHNQEEKLPFPFVLERGVYGNEKLKIVPVCGSTTGLPGRSDVIMIKK